MRIKPPKQPAEIRAHADFNRLLGDLSAGQGSIRVDLPHGDRNRQGRPSPFRLAPRPTTRSRMALRQAAPGPFDSHCVSGVMRFDEEAALGGGQPDGDGARRLAALLRPLRGACE